MNGKTVVVCGATGNQGGAVVQSLLNSQKWDVIALSRNPTGGPAQALKNKGVVVKKADLQDKVSLIQAFQNAYGVYGVTEPWSPDNKKCNISAEIEQGHNIADACLQTGIKHLVLSTVLHFGMEKTGISHVDSKLLIEEHVLKSKVPCTFLKPASFMDNIGAPYFPVKKGSITGFVDGDAKVVYVSCVDIGVFAGIAFENPDKYIGKAIDLVGDFISGEELCNILSRLRKGEHFKYKAVPRLLIRIFAKEFYQMRLTFEKWGRPPYPKEIGDAINNCRSVYPKIMSLEQYLQYKGYETKNL